MKRKKQLPQQLDPADARNYPVDSRSELQQIADEAHTQATMLQELLNLNTYSDTPVKGHGLNMQLLSHVAGAHVLIMRLAAYVQSIEGKQ